MSKKNIKNKKVVLLILDGWGLGKKNDGNPIHLAKTPFIDLLYKKYPWVKIGASDGSVGLPVDMPGNSEAGHENLGAGRIVCQDVVKISRQISTGEFFKNPAFLATINHTKKSKTAVHLMGMLSTGKSPHGDPDHLLALLTLLRKKQVKKVYLHLFTDGRDSPPRAGLRAVEALERFLKPHEVIATVIGRFYAMDRKKCWPRTQMAYNAMVIGTGHEAKSPQEGITRAYNADVTDQYIEPIVMYQKGKMVPRIQDDDAIIFFNLRSDRARQMSKPFVQDHFEKMNPGSKRRRKVLKNIVFAAMTDFGPDLDGILTAYPSEDLKDTLPMLLADKKQIYIAESEKYAHVTYFFNGGYADPIGGEDRINIPSPNVERYAHRPAMSTAKVAQKIIGSLKKYDFICANFACPDMIGHTGDIKAGIIAAQAVDRYVKKVAQAALKKDACLIITSDHGNLEYMFNTGTGEIVTEHTTNPVPFIIVSNNIKKKPKAGGVLASVAPTILKIMGVKKTKFITKQSLI